MAIESQDIGWRSNLARLLPLASESRHMDAIRHPVLQQAQHDNVAEPPFLQGLTNSMKLRIYLRYNMRKKEASVRRLPCEARLG
eukprot:435253-Amphidinium_carterae.1